MSAVEEARELIDSWLFAEVNKLIEICQATESSSSDSGSEQESSVIISSRAQSPETVEPIEDRSSLSCCKCHQTLNNSAATDKVYSENKDNVPAGKQVEIELECGGMKNEDKSDEPSLLSEDFVPQTSGDDSDETCSQRASDKEEGKSVTIESPPGTCTLQGDLDMLEHSFADKPEGLIEEDEAVVKRRFQQTEQEWKLMTPDVRKYLQLATKKHIELYSDEKYDEEAPIPGGIFMEILQYAYSWNCHRLEKTLPSPPRCPLLADIPDNVVIFFVKVIYARFGAKEPEGTPA